MHQSSTSRRVDFDDTVTIETLKRSHPLRSSFLHGDPSNKASRSSTRSHTATIRKSNRQKKRPGECPVHGKKVAGINSIPDVVIPVPISRQNSSEESIGVQPVPLANSLKGQNGSGVQKRQGWAGLQWALLMGCYALMLLLAVVVGVVLIYQHRENNPADSDSGTLPNQLNEGISSDLTQGPKRGPFPGIDNKPTEVSPNQIRAPKSASDGPPSRTLRGRPKSLASQEFLGNTFGSQTSHRRPKVQQAGVSIFPIQQSSQPSLTGPQSRQPNLLPNQGLHPSLSGNQDRGSHSQPSLTGPQSRQPHLQPNQGLHPSLSGNRDRGSHSQPSLTGPQLRQPHLQPNQGLHPSLSGNRDRGSPSLTGTQSRQPHLQPNQGHPSLSGNQDRGSPSLTGPQSRQPHLQPNQGHPSLSGNQDRGSPSLTGPQSRQPHLQPNQGLHPSLSGNQDRGSPGSRSPTRQTSSPADQNRGSSFPRQQTNQKTFSQQNNHNRGSSLSTSPTRQSASPGDQTRGSSFTRQQTNQQTSSQLNNQDRGSSISRSPVRPSSFPGDQTRSSSFPASSRQFPNQPSSGNQQRNLSSHPRQRSNQPHRPRQNSRNPSSRQKQSRRPSQTHLQEAMSQLPFNTDPAVKPRLPFEQLHRPASPERTRANLPSLDGDFTLAGNPGIPGKNDSEVKIAKLWNHQNSDGSFTYGYVNTDGSFKNETRGIGGCVEGIYGYLDAISNQEVRVPYKTGNSGNNCNVPQPPWPPQTG